MLCKYCEVTLEKEANGEFATCPSCQRKYVIKKVDPSKPKVCRICGGLLMQNGDLWFCNSCKKAFKFSSASNAPVAKPSAPTPKPTPVAVQSAPIPKPVATFAMQKTAPIVTKTPDDDFLNVSNLALGNTPKNKPSSENSFSADDLAPNDFGTDELSADDLIPVNSGTDELSADDLIPVDSGTDDILSDDILSDDILSDDSDTDDILSDDIITDDISTDDSASGDILSDDLFPKDLTAKDLIPYDAHNPEHVRIRTGAANMPKQPKEVPALLDDNQTYYPPSQSKPVDAGVKPKVATNPSETIKPVTPINGINSDSKSRSSDNSSNNAGRLIIGIILGVLTALCGIAYFVFSTFSILPAESPLSSYIIYIGLAFGALFAISLLILAIVCKGFKKIGLFACFVSALLELAIDIISAFFNTNSFAIFLSANSAIIQYLVQALLFVGSFLVLVFNCDENIKLKVNAFAICGMVFVALTVAFNFFGAIPFEDWKLTAVEFLKDYTPNLGYVFYSLLCIPACIAIANR